MRSKPIVVDLDGIATTDRYPARQNSATVYALAQYTTSKNQVFAEH